MHQISDINSNKRRRDTAQHSELTVPPARCRSLLLRSSFLLRPVSVQTHHIHHRRGKNAFLLSSWLCWSFQVLHGTAAWMLSPLAAAQNLFGHGPVSVRKVVHVVQLSCSCLDNSPGASSSRFCRLIRFNDVLMSLASRCLRTIDRSIDLKIGAPAYGRHNRQRLSGNASAGSNRFPGSERSNGAAVNLRRSSGEQRRTRPGGDHGAVGRAQGFRPGVVGSGSGVLGEIDPELQY